MNFARLSVVGALGVVAAALALVLALRGGGGRAAEKPTAAAPAPCSARLLRDWADGRIDGTYTVGCYRAALKSLPADLRVYSSAEDDIAQALSQRIVLSRHPQKISGHQGAPAARKIASAR